MQGKAVPTSHDQSILKERQCANLVLLRLAACDYFKQCYMPALRAHAARYHQLSVAPAAVPDVWVRALLSTFCRVCRKTVKDPELLIQVPDADNLALAETILRAGSSQFPSSAYLLLVKAGIQSHLKGDKAVSFVMACGPDMG